MKSLQPTSLYQSPLEGPLQALGQKEGPTAWPSLPQTPCVILRLPEVLRVRGRSRSSHYQDIKEGLFPEPVRLGARSVGWPEQEVMAVNAARVAGLTEEHIKSLVNRLVEARRGKGRG